MISLDNSEAKMYVFHVLAHGLTNDSIPFSLSPLDEIVVQVCGTTACT